MTANRDMSGQRSDVADGGYDVRSMNINAGKEVGEIVRSTLGPMGMDKLLIDNDGMGIVTNDGATVLKEMADNPIVDLVREAAKGQESAVGDGTTTTAVLTGQLLAEAEDLLDRGLHPMTVVRGYETAAMRTRDTLRETAIAVNPVDTDVIRDVATTAMTNKGISTNDEVLADLVIKVVDRIADEDGFDIDDVYVEKEPGSRVETSGVASNVLLDNGRASPSMPYGVEDATLALIDGDVGEADLRTDSRTTVTDRADAERFREFDRQSLARLVDSLVNLGVDVLICSGRVDQRARRALANADVYAAEHTESETLSQLAGASGANIVHNPRRVGESDLGSAESVMEMTVDNEPKTSVKGFDGADVVMLLLRGSQMNLLDELHRALENGLEAVQLVLTDEKILPGGGASEMAVARSLRVFANSVGGREQPAVAAFADALEVIPRTFIENAGQDPLDGIVGLRTAQERDGSRLGIDGYSGEPIDVVDCGVCDPLGVKAAAIENATQAATMILRIDDALPTTGDEQ